MLRLATIPTLIALLLAAPAVRAKEASLARLLPAETALFLETRNPTPEEAEAMAANRALSEPAFRKVLDRMLNDSSSLTSMRTPIGRAALAVTVDVGSSTAKVRYFDAEGERTLVVKDRVSIAWIGWQEGPIPVDLVAGVEVGGDPGDALDLLKRLMAALLLEAQGRSSGSIDDEIERSIRDTTVDGVRRIRVEFRGFGIHFAVLDGLLVGTTSEARLADMMRRAAGDGTGSLHKTADFRRVAGATGGRGTATTLFLVRADRVLKTLETPFPQQVASARGLLHGFGLQGLRGLESVTWVDGEGVSSKTTLSITDHGRGLGRLFAPGEPAHLDLLGFAPKETFYVSTGKMDAGELWNIALEVGGLPVGVVEQEFRRFFGLELKRELLDRVGPEAALIVSRTNGLLPDVGLVVESKDAAKLEETLRRMLERVPWPAGSGLQSIPLGDVTAHVAALGHPRLAEVPIAPTFGVVDGKLLVALYPISFQRFLAVSRGERPSLADNRDFVTLRKRVPANAESVSYLDLPSLVALGYDTLVPILQSMPNQNQVSSLYGLPDADLLTRHLYGRIGWRVADETGMHWHSHAAVDTTGFVLGAIGAVGGYLSRVTVVEQAELQIGLEERPARKGAAARPDEKDREMREDRARIRQLRARIQLYRMQNDGALPPSLDAVRAAHVDAETFASAPSGKPWVYLGPNGRGGILLHGYPNGSDQKVHALFLKGFAVERISSEELEERLNR